MVQYKKTVDATRRVEVQLWGDGKHRAAHWIGGRMATEPTEFADVPSMHDAITHEETRTDHPSLNETSGASGGSTH